ncbi:hypothetical protein [Prochlorococcus sp. MIT 1307]|nr:hypothetical protein [Prochlorococcus sp. MIT 1307]
MNRDLLVRDCSSTNQGGAKRAIAIDQAEIETQQTVVTAKGTEQENSE